MNLGFTYFDQSLLALSAYRFVVFMPGALGGFTHFLCLCHFVFYKYHINQ